jgi:hypothetical protein
MTPEQFDAFMKIFQQVMTAQRPSWYEHVDLMGVVLYGLIGFTFYRLIRNIDDLYHKYNGLSDVLHTLRGEHNEREGVTHKCRRKEDIHDTE